MFRIWAPSDRSLLGTVPAKLRCALAYDPPRRYPCSCWAAVRTCVDSSTYHPPIPIRADRCAPTAPTTPSYLIPVVVPLFYPPPFSHLRRYAHPATHPAIVLPRAPASTIQHPAVVLPSAVLRRCALPSLLIPPSAAVLIPPPPLSYPAVVLTTRLGSPVSPMR